MLELPSNPEEYLAESQARRVEIGKQISSLMYQWDDLFADEVQIKSELARARTVGDV